jgi:hypothetical protein
VEARPAARDGQGASDWLRRRCRVYLFHGGQPASAQPVYPGAPKNTEAALRISLAFLSCLTSPRSRASSSRSTVVSRSWRGPGVRFGLAHPELQRLLVEPRSRATAAIGR